MAVREPVAQAQKVSPEAVMALRRPSEIALSPDGSRVAATVSASFSRKGERVQTSIWLAQTDGGGSRELISGPGQNALPRWSPSGERLAFASDRDHPGRMTLYVLGIDDPGAVSALGDIAGSVEDAQWSPDGASLLVLAADLGADRAGAQTATKIVEQDAEEEDPTVTRPARAWRRLYRVDAATGETSEVSPEGVNVWEFDWRGGAAAAICSDEPSESTWYDAYVALLDLDDCSARTLHVPEWQIQGPKLSPDGTRVAFLEGFCSDRGILAGTVRVVDVGDAGVRPLAAELDVGMVAWRDDETLLYAGWRGMGSSIGTLTLDGAAEELHGGSCILGIRYAARVSASADAATLVSILDGPDDPPEIVVLDDDGPRAITELNTEAGAEIPRPNWERFAWEAADGLEIEGLLALPPGLPATALPLVVLVHGGPTSCWSWEFAPYRGIANLLAASGYAVLLPNPRGSAGRGQDFARANLGDMGGGDL
jgi:dipeptidyl aminopeptidase/acylaminoacyl peptidase